MAATEIYFFYNNDKWRLRNR